MGSGTANSGGPSDRNAKGAEEDSSLAPEAKPDALNESGPKASEERELTLTVQNQVMLWLKLLESDSSVIIPEPNELAARLSCEEQQVIDAIEGLGSSISLRYQNQVARSMSSINEQLAEIALTSGRALLDALQKNPDHCEDDFASRIASIFDLPVEAVKQVFRDKGGLHPLAEPATTGAEDSSETKPATRTWTEELIKQQLAQWSKDLDSLPTELSSRSAMGEFFAVRPSVVERLQKEALGPQGSKEMTAKMTEIRKEEVQRKKEESHQALADEMRKLISGERELPDSVTSYEKLAAELDSTRYLVETVVNERLSAPERSQLKDLLGTSKAFREQSAIKAERTEMAYRLRELIALGDEFPAELSSYETVAKQLGCTRYLVETVVNEQLSAEEKGKLKELLGTTKAFRSKSEVDAEHESTAGRLRELIALGDNFPAELSSYEKLANHIGCTRNHVEVVANSRLEAEELKKLKALLGTSKVARSKEAIEAERTLIADKLKLLICGEIELPGDPSNFEDIGKALGFTHYAVSKAAEEKLSDAERKQLRSYLRKKRVASSKEGTKESYAKQLSKLQSFASDPKSIPEEIITNTDMAKVLGLREGQYGFVTREFLSDSEKTAIADELNSRRRLRDKGQKSEKYEDVLTKIQQIVSGELEVPREVDSYLALASFLGVSDNYLRNARVQLPVEVDEQFEEKLGLFSLDRLRAERRELVVKAADFLREEFEKLRAGEIDQVRTHSQLASDFNLEVQEVAFALRAALTREQRDQRSEAASQAALSKREQAKLEKNSENCRRYILRQVRDFLDNKADSILGNEALAHRYSLPREKVDDIVDALPKWKQAFRREVLEAKADRAKKRAIRAQYKPFRD